MSGTKNHSKFKYNQTNLNVAENKTLC